MCGAVDLCSCAGCSRCEDGGPSVALVAAAKDDEEGTAEGLVEEGIEDGVKHGVDVAQPQACCPQLFGHCVVYERVHHVGDEEWSPAQAKAAHNDAQSLCCFCLSAHAVVPLVLSTLRAGDCVTCPLQHADLTGVFTCRYIDALVGEHHQTQWDVEGHHRAGESIWLVHHEHTHRGVATELPRFYLLRGDGIFMRTQIAHSAHKKKMSHFILHSVLSFLFSVCSLLFQSLGLWPGGTVNLSVVSRGNISYNLNLKAMRP